MKMKLDAVAISNRKLANGKFRRRLERDALLGIMIGAGWLGSDVQIKRKYSQVLAELG